MIVKKGPTNSSMSKPPLFGQCLKENELLISMSSLKGLYSLKNCHKPFGMGVSLRLLIDTNYIWRQGFYYESLSFEKMAHVP